MVQWQKLLHLNGDRDRRHEFRDEFRRLLPITSDDVLPSAIPPKEVTKVALRLKYQIEQVIPCELDEAKVTQPHSPILTKQVVETTKKAGGEEYKACIVYCLLVCKRWFHKQALCELWDAEMHNVRATACEVLAKLIIESEQDQNFLLSETLLKRYSIIRNGEETRAANVIERAVDLHALRVIGSSGYQKCIKFLWKGWLVQDDEDTSRFIDYKQKDSTNYWDHFDPDRMRAPIYQNALQIFFSLLYLALYTGAINTINKTADLDIVEVILYIMTLGFICDEIAKFWKIGRFYFGFWNAFNSALYGLLIVSFVTRMIALSHPLKGDDDEKRKDFNQLSYNFLAFSAPMFWMRLLLFLDTFRFFGAMLVVLKVMMRESLIFFALLVVVIVGFLQAFVGMDQADDNGKITSFIIQAMANSVMQSPDFDGFDKFAPPFGIILYYVFTFVVMVILLNILIALYNSAYEDITDNASDEYMALFSEKTIQFVRAPDENVFIAPLNLIEMFFLILPFEWWLPSHQYDRLNDYVMGVIYSPLLLITAWFETRQAYEVCSNRSRGEEDDDTIEEWEQMTGEIDMEAEGWTKQVAHTKPNVEASAAVVEVREMRKELRELAKTVEKLKQEDTMGESSTVLGESTYEG
ncbi:MAG: hypothetical protein M1834_007474 [Cirrosporium novae-zelandiae]|nr:MAG: hypothetical protein M1834_007474 [Cirrosporium novae-zelandiae]